MAMDNQHEESPQDFNELGLQFRNKRPKRRNDHQDHIGSNDIWATGVVRDQFYLDKKLCFLRVGQRESATSRVSWQIVGRPVDGPYPRRTVSSPDSG